MQITTTPKIHYKMVEIKFEDSNTKIECNASGKNELLELKEQLETALADVNYVLEDIEIRENILKSI
tara:strand:+ start:88 stop:288 length:201 start_codon:yes stop_codon:yes gene_type:complete